MNTGGTLLRHGPVFIVKIHILLEITKSSRLINEQNVFIDRQIGYFFYRFN